MSKSQRELFREIGRAIDKDKEIRTYDQPEAKECSWLAFEPHSAEEVAESIYEQLSALGATFEINGSEANAPGFMAAYLARKRAQGETSLF